MRRIAAALLGAAFALGTLATPAGAARKPHATWTFTCDTIKTKEGSTAARGDGHCTPSHGAPKAKGWLVREFRLIGRDKKSLVCRMTRIPAPPYDVAGAANPRNACRATCAPRPGAVSHPGRRTLRHAFPGETAGMRAGNRRRARFLA
ncbi:hypothetical protein NKH77_17230 [Streptomyces sp. M19]